MKDRTPAFRRWFGDSKVVDENGQPLIVWHGHPRNVDPFYVFDFDRAIDIGMHFGSEDAAFDVIGSTRSARTVPSLREHVRPFYLSLSNPLVMEDLGDWISSGLGSFRVPALEQLFKMGIVDAAKYEEAYEKVKAVREGPTRVQEVSSRRAALSSIVRDLILDAGYDGIVYTNENEDVGSTAWIAFYPEQIKLADGTNTTFDPKSHDVRFNPRPDSEAITATTNPAIDTLHALRDNWAAGGDMGRPDGFVAVREGVDGGAEDGEAFGGEAYAVKIELWTDDCLMDLKKQDEAAARRRGEALAKKWAKEHWPHTGYVDLGGAEGVYGATWAWDKATENELERTDPDEVVRLPAARANPSRKPLDKDLYEAVKEEAKRKFDVWPSAYASGWVVKTYKARGGRYAGGDKKTRSGLTKWFGEEWVDLSRPIHDEDGELVGYEPCGRQVSDDPAAYPKCRPLAEALRMSPSEVKDAIKRKRAAEAKAAKGRGGRGARAPVRVSTYRVNPALRKKDFLAVLAVPENRKAVEKFVDVVRAYQSDSAGYKSALANRYLALPESVQDAISEPNANLKKLYRGDDGKSRARATSWTSSLDYAKLFGQYVFPYAALASHGGTINTHKLVRLLDFAFEDHDVGDDENEVVILEPVWKSADSDDYLVKNVKGYWFPRE